MLSSETASEEKNVSNSSKLCYFFGLPFRSTTCASVTNESFVRNYSYENVLRKNVLQVHFHANQSNFHMKSFASRLVLKQRPKVTRKWPIKK